MGMGMVGTVGRDILLKRYIMPNTPEFALQRNPLGIVGAGRRRPVRRPALRIRVVVVVLHTVST